MVCAHVFPIGCPTAQTTDSLTRYQARLAARPLLTQSITTSVLFGVGDITAQQLVAKRGFDKHDYARTGRMMLYGGSEYRPTLAITTVPPLASC